MITYLRGGIRSATSHYIILEANGIGWKVHTAPETASTLKQEQEAEVWCHLHVRENVMELYGVPTQGALEVFETVNGISGIGPKAALQISSLGSLRELKEAVEAEDEKFFASVHGIGKKKIQKIILELTGKIADIEQKPSVDEDALDALRQLGFTAASARDALKKAPEDLQSTEERVSAALRLLGK